MATLWKNGGALLSCQGLNNDKTSCCNDVWHLLQTLCEEESKDGSEWCAMENFKDFELQCRKQITSTALPDAPANDGDYWHALFLSRSIQEEQNEASVKEWKQWINRAWNDGALVSPFVGTLASSPSFSANLQSTLSSDGGMHRLLHHNISFTCPPETSSYQASFYMMVFVTEHFFIDVDDSFVSSQENVIPSLHSRERIDIEQPAFVSPQHVVIVNVDANGMCKNDSQQESYVAFATKLHVRYPPLTGTGHLHVSFPAPLLYSGYLVDTTTPSTTLQGQNYTLSTSDFRWQSPISVQVATGFQDDYLLVGIVTILASLVGSFFLLRNMSKVSVWK
jgi:hypothetical protein